MQKVLITEKHLTDKKSDLLYEPFRQIGIMETKNIFQPIKQALIPKKLEKLQVASNQVIPVRNYVKLGEKLRIFQPVQQAVAYSLILKAPQNQSIIYKYGNFLTPKSQKYEKRRYESYRIQDIPQNRIDFSKQKQYIKKIKLQEQKYNILSVLDGPFNYLANKMTFTCGDCNNQIVASSKYQMIVQFDQRSQKQIKNNRVIKK